jgi:NADPH:quinone reductase-like Zn-dependent oxidoreductase
MKAVVHYDYGSPDVLRCEEIEKPVPGTDQVLLKVHAASVNPLDGHLMKGVPFVGRLPFGFRKPRRKRPGVDVAGVVEAVGGNVKQFQPGDRVFGTCRGAFADYVCTSPTTLAALPELVTFEQAASAPIAALTALQGLRDKGRLEPGQKALINGAAGGVGTYAVQIAKRLGAEVAAVCSTRNVDLVRSLGADRVVDYTREDFTRGGERYDLIFDLVANHPVLACRRVLQRKGRYVLGGVLSGRVTRFLAFPIKALVLSPFTGQKFIVFIAKPTREDLQLVGELIATGKVKPVVETRQGWSAVPEAIRRVQQGHARGKVVICPEN